LIVGGGRKFNDYRRLAHLQLFNQYVTFTGFLPKSLVNKIYGAADVFVYPKTLDPEPLAVIESLAAGTPVVAVKGLGAQDFVSDNQDGLISSVSVEEFADKIIELTRRNKMRLEFSLRARANAKRFRASNLTCDLVELYESVISRNKDKFF
jgi:glycosyltransferase involved in cell wall biosynthesis